MVEVSRSQIVVQIMKEILWLIKEMANVVFVMQMETLFKDLLKMINLMVKANIFTVI